MKLKEYHPLSEMERVPAEDISERLDGLPERMDKENVRFVITEEGKDSCVLCPYKWFEPEYETVEVEIDELLAAQVEEIIKPLGWTMEQLCVRFLEWLVDPDTREEAITTSAGSIGIQSRSISRYCMCNLASLITTGAENSGVEGISLKCLDKFQWAVI